MSENFLSGGDSVFVMNFFFLLVKETLHVEQERKRVCSHFKCASERRDSCFGLVVQSEFY